MRKISNVDDAIEKFKIAANDNYECSYNGNYRKSNRAYDDLIQIEKYLFENNALDLLKQLYEDPNLWVRLAAAIVMAPWDEINAFNIVVLIKSTIINYFYRFFYFIVCLCACNTVKCFTIFRIDIVVDYL